MAAQIRSNFGAILEAIKNQLVAEIEIPAERVLIVVRRNVPHFAADQDIVLRPLGFRVDRQITDQTGRFLTAIVRRLEVRARTRLTLDEASRDEQWLLHETLGHLALEEGIVDALQEFIPLDNDVDQNALTYEPILLSDGTDPEQMPDRGQPTDWGESRLIFDVPYVMSLTLE